MVGLTKVRPGQKLRGLSASDWNRFIDTVHAVESLKSAIVDQSSQPRAGIVQVLNEEAFGFSQFDVVGLDDILFSHSDSSREFKTNASFRVLKPAADTLHKFAIMQEPLPQGTGRMAAALAHGVTVCRLNIIDEDHKYAKATAGEWTQLETCSAGPATILWKETGTGTSKWGVVKLDALAAEAVIVARVVYIGGTAVANVVQCEVGSISAKTTLGYHPIGFTADSPQNLVTVYEPNGPPPRIGDVVVAVLIGEQYVIVKTNGRIRLKGVVTSPGGIALNGSGQVRIYEAGLATSRYETAINRWMSNAAIAVNAQVIVEYFPDEAQWHIVQAACPAA